MISQDNADMEKSELEKKLFKNERNAKKNTEAILKNSIGLKFGHNKCDPKPPTHDAKPQIQGSTKHIKKRNFKILGNTSLQVLFAFESITSPLLTDNLFVVGWNSSVPFWQTILTHYNFRTNSGSGQNGFREQPEKRPEKRPEKQPKPVLVRYSCAICDINCDMI